MSNLTELERDLLESLKAFLVERPIDQVIGYAAECRARALAAIDRANAKEAGIPDHCVCNEAAIINGAFPCDYCMPPAAAK